MSQIHASIGDASRNASNREPILEIRNLSVTFRNPRILRRAVDTKAVDDVSLKLYGSEILSLVGESGSGKTTIARCILRLNDTTTGTITCNGTDISKLKRKALKLFRRDVQIIFQDPYESLNPRQDVLTAIGTPIRELLGETDDTVVEDRVVKLLTEVELDPVKTIRKLPYQLSGGEMQRVSIARALATEPKLLIADEPITMLDAAQRLNVLSLLAKLKTTRHLSILMITHDLASAKLVSDRVAIIYLGKLVELGETRVVLSRPHHPYVELILASIPSREKPLALGSSVSQTLGEDARVAQGCVFRSRCPYATDICGTDEPKLEAKTEEEGHVAACHHPLSAN